ncbi:MAG TPA: peroxidase-related enzyme, partial [Vicinamibacteria bacterium]|nr:peroxidase-related enzyme [Vicinamibacteria bacterium]
MPFIDLPEGLPGIRGPMAFRPETARPMSELAEVLLRGESTLTPAEREMIAAHVSARNECVYCATSHAAIASHYLGDEAVVHQATQSPETAPISAKLKALLAIAGRVQESGRSVREEHIARARAEGATDREIHDTVLIAAAFSMFNRYVDGLATWTPTDPASYRERAAGIARNGYAGLPDRLLASQGQDPARDRSPR